MNELKKYGQQYYWVAWLIVGLVLVGLMFGYVKVKM